MAIGRPQIPAEIDAFATGGIVTPSNDQFSQLGAMMTSRFQPFEQNVQKYQQRLAPYVYQAPRMNIYDFASELGAGLLSTPNTGGASAFTGLGVGFNRVSDRLRNAREENAKARNQIGLQAAQLAMQDEQGALQFLQEYELKNLDYKNKRGDLITFEYTDPATKQVVTQTVRDNIANDAIIEDLITTKGAVEVKSPSSVVNVGGTNLRATKAIASQYASEDDILARERAGVSTIANVNEALAIAERIGPENFGPKAQMTLYGRKWLSSFGINDENADELLGDQLVLNQISMGFTMDIVSRTKGAISNREMELFIAASPGLGSNYNGFLKQANYLKRIGERDVAFSHAYNQKAEELEAQVDRGEVTDSQLTRKLRRFESDWYDQNLIFSKDETEELKNIVSGRQGYAEEFDENVYAKKYREGQEKVVKSAYTTNQSPQLQEAIDLKDKIKDGVGKYAKLNPEERADALAKVDALIKELSEI